MEVCETPPGAALHACMGADLPCQGSGFSHERSAELGQLWRRLPDHTPESAQMNAMAQIWLGWGVGWGEGLPHCSIITRHTKLLSQGWRSVYVGQGKERPSSYPAVWDTSRIINIHSPKAVQSLLHSEILLWKVGEKFPWLCWQMPSQHPFPLQGGWGLGKPSLTRHLQPCLCGACSLWENEKVPFLTDGQTATGSSSQVFCCCNYPPETSL